MMPQKLPSMALVADRVPLDDRHGDALLRNTLVVANECRLSWEETVLLIEEVERRSGIWLRLERE